MANFFTRALDVITPWNRGGELVRRKKREEEEAQRRQNQPRPTQQPNRPTQVPFAPGQAPQPQRPENLFADLNKSLSLGRPLPGVVPVNPVLQKPLTPQPGDVVKPTAPKAPLVDQEYRTIVNKEQENKKIFGKNVAWALPKSLEKRRKVAVEGSYKTNEDKFIAQFDKMDQERREIYLRGIREQAKNKVDEQGREIEGSYDPVAYRSLKALESKNRAGSQRDMLQRAADIASVPGRSVTRVATGIGQGLTGLYDLATPGKGNNRASSFLDSVAKEQDTSAEEAGVGTAYRVVNVPTEIASYFIPSTLATKIASKVPRGARITEDLVNFVAKNVDDAGEAGKIRKFLADRMRRGWTLDQALEESLQSAKYTGENASKGNDTSPGSVFTDVATAVGGSLLFPGNRIRKGMDQSDEAIEDAAGAVTATASEIAENNLNRRKIPVSKNIPVDEAVGDNLDVPVSVNTPEKPTGPIIREVGGDAERAITSDEILDQAAQARRDAANATNAGAKPDPRIQGVTTNPREIITRADKAEAQMVLDDYQKIGKITDEEHANLSDQLAKTPAADDPVAPGTKIAVKQIDSIPITDQTNVPQNLPETPGTVRVTGATDPNQARTAAVASQPTVALPREIQEVLDNPKQFNKRQVAAARNQRKLAVQMAKTQEQTAEALARIETASPAAQSGEGFVPTGEFAKSQNGGPYQKASRTAEMQQAVEETANMSPQDVISTARTNQGDTGGFNRRDIRNIAAMFENKRITRGTPEWEEARQILKEDGTVWGQQGALRNYTMRRTATTNELISRYESKIYRLADDPAKIQSSWFDEVEAAEDAYVRSRDDAMAAYNEFTRNPTNANAKAFHAAQDAAEKADTAAKQTEYTVAQKALKGNKDVQQARELDKLANEADMYQMDAVDASMLSGTGTFVRNFVNSAIGGSEEGLFGGVASRIAKAVTGQNVGGGFGKGSIKGFKEGAVNLVDSSKARASAAGKNPLEHVKNWATTGNQLGDTVIDSQIRHNVLDHYTQLLKEQGYKGRELTDRAGVMARVDPDNLSRTYSGYARAAAGLGSGVTRGNKFETFIKNTVSDLFPGDPNRATEFAGKLFARMTVGFPTAIGRSAAEGTKRMSFGTLNALKLFGREARNNPAVRAQIIKESIKQAGSGATVSAIFYGLGQQGLISGAYPTDEAERAQWEREGKTENSIRIAGAWYQLPAFLGSVAIPAMFSASLGRNDGDIGTAVAETAKSVPSMLPTDQASDVMDFINGRTDPGKFIAQTGAGAVRAMTPGGAALNEIAKMFDSSKNDTNSGTNLENFLDKVYSGIPYVNNKADIPDKVSDTGEVITNPQPGELFMGAASDVQGGGEQRSREIQAQGDQKLQSFVDRGVFDDPNMKEVLDDKSLAIYNKIKNNKKLKPGELEDLQAAFVKGVSSEGTDTAFLEREQYDSNLRALEIKKELMEADKTVKPSSLKDIDTAIKRGRVYKDNQIPYEMIAAYQSTGVDDWRNMGDPEDEDYNPEMYQALFNIDRQLTEVGASYAKGKLDKPKYTAKNAGKGRGGSGTKQLDTSFGTLKDAAFAPRVREYDSLDAKSGGVPIIRTVRPNIVHKISSSG